MADLLPRTDEEILGRASVDDIDSILAITTPDDGKPGMEVHSVYDTHFTWDYEQGSRAKLARLYEKAKTSQWNGQTDLPWETDVDQEKVVAANAAAANGMDGNIDWSGTQMQSWGDKEWLQFGIESQNWTLSQFMHGEQG
ncbi:MAG: P-aminobenzoate N-oxygenase AurF, partial [Actinomycetia bacterium]|nr:P-aminobenzoate N-oxygenase AurF [Actinomycetes bacterium]